MAQAITLTRFIFIMLPLRETLPVPVSIVMCGICGAECHESEAEKKLRPLNG
jgi:hypothetical protein